MTLTGEGMRVAESLSERHGTLREFLVILGMDPPTADDEACKIEHVVQPDTMALLTDFVEFISTSDNPRWLDEFHRYRADGDLEGCPGRCRRDGRGGDPAEGAEDG